MTKEWSTSINSFNSMKCLLWRPQLSGIANKQYLRPLTVGLDPSNHCNLNCIWCISKNIRKHNKDMENILDVCNVIIDWGIEAVCIGGGGEPFSNRDTWKAIQYLNYWKIEIGIATNGTLLTDRDRDTIVNYSRFCGISIDAGCKEDYLKLKKGDYFHRVLDNIRYMIEKRDEHKSQITFCYKFLIAAAYLSEKKLISVDIATPQFTATGKFTDNWDFRQQDALEFLENYDEKIEFIFIDDCHTYPHVKKELEIIATKVDKSSIILMHDLMGWKHEPEYYIDGTGWEFEGGGPGRAVLELNKDIWEYATLPYCNGLTLLRRIN